MSVGSEPATSGSVSPTDGKISPATIGVSQRSFCCGVPYRCSMIESCIETLPTAS